MKHLMILLGVVLVSSHPVIAQKLVKDKKHEKYEVRHGIHHTKHPYQSMVHPWDDSGMINNIPTKWVLVNSEGLFHTTKIPKAAPSNEDLQPWDSLYYANRDYLTFHFNELIAKKADTIHVTDYSDDDDRFYIGYIEGAFINGVKEGLWEKQVYGRVDSRLSIFSRVIAESYKNGVLHGMRTIYDLKGEYLSRSLFVDGTGDYNDYYYDTRKPAVLGFMVYGKRHGRWLYFNRDGQLIREENYEQGVLDGPLTIYDDEGNVLFTTNFKNGTGEYRHYRNGVMRERGQMINGLRTGEWQTVSICTYSYSTPRRQDPGPHLTEHTRNYTDQDPENDPGNIIDVMFYDGEYIYLRAKRDK